MKKIFTPLLLLVSATLVAQDYSTFTSTVQNLYSLKTTEEVNKVWHELVEAEHIPLIAEDSVAFLYRGQANSVAWVGDFNRWGYSETFNNKGKRIRDTDIWILKAKFPIDSRLDYKIVINENNYILDPHNADHQWSGVGGGSPNSELRMPGWQEDALTLHAVEHVKKGKLRKDLLLNSKVLGYQTTYSIYIPHHYRTSHQYPVIYVTDGYEYMHDRLGNMVTVLDNLIHLEKIQPVIAVFIDHREPVNRSNNRRMQELAMNEKYLQFITDELIPVVERNYSISKDPAHRAVLGNSMGGLSAAYFAFTKPNVFGLAGIQSPTFWFKPEIYTLCDNPENPPVKMFMTTGLINDAEEGTRKMKAILDKNTCAYQYKEVNQGQSWGNSRDLIDDILVYFFPFQQN
jgi:enterochelin esterase family protein